jgi:hypothetical protein
MYVSRKKWNDQQINRTKQLSRETDHLVYPKAIAVIIY